MVQSEFNLMNTGFTCVPCCAAANPRGDQRFALFAREIRPGRRSRVRSVT